MAGALRACGADLAGGAAAIVLVDPADGATGVVADAPVVVCVSQPLDEASVARGLCVRDPSGPVPGRLRLAASGRMVVWSAEQPLRADVVHFVVANGLRDARGRPLPDHLSRFVPCDLRATDLGE